MLTNVVEPAVGAGYVAVAANVVPEIAPEITKAALGKLEDPEIQTDTIEVSGTASARYLPGSILPTEGRFRIDMD